MPINNATALQRIHQRSARVTATRVLAAVQHARTQYGLIKLVLGHESPNLGEAIFAHRIVQHRNLHVLQHRRLGLVLLRSAPAGHKWHVAQKVFAPQRLLQRQAYGTNKLAKRYFGGQMQNGNIIVEFLWLIVWMFDRLGDRNVDFVGRRQVDVVFAEARR